MANTAKKSAGTEAFPSGRVPPHDIEAEQCVLSSMMLDRQYAAVGIGMLRASDFYRPAHGMTFKAIAAVYERRGPMDAYLVKDELGSKIEEVGGFEYLMAIISQVPSGSHIEHYAKIVQDKAQLRRLHDALPVIQGLVHGDRRAEEVFAEAAEILARIREQQTAASLPAVSLAELLAEPPATSPWLVESLLPETGLAMLAADPGECKTWTALHLGLSVAAGLPFLGHFPTRRGTVLIVDLENGRARIHKRAEKLKAGMEIKDDLPLSFAFISSLRLDQDEAANRFTDGIRQANPSLVIIDSLRRVHQGDENDSSLAARVGGYLHALAEELQICVLVTHHLRKPSAFGSNRVTDRVRGSGDWLANSDCLLTLSRKRPGILGVSHGKSRDCEELPEFLVELALGEGDAPATLRYLGQAKGDGKREGVAEKILAHLSRTGSAVNRDLYAFAEEWGCSEATIRRSLDDLKTGGRIDGTGGRGKAVRYVITDPLLLEESEQ
jgi:hypothetical protein